MTQGGRRQTHADSGYELNACDALQALAEQERSGYVRAAQRLRDSGIALSVLTTVIGHRPEKGWARLDAGWMEHGILSLTESKCSNGSMLQDIRTRFPNGNEAQNSAEPCLRDGCAIS